MKRFIASENQKPGDPLEFDRAVMGARNCARSPTTNELDWTPRCILADPPMSGADADGARGPCMTMVASQRLQLGDG
jgi:hypothetical protein